MRLSDGQTRQCTRPRRRGRTASCASACRPNWRAVGGPGLARESHGLRPGRRLIRLHVGGIEKIMRPLKVFVRLAGLTALVVGAGQYVGGSSGALTALVLAGLM